MCSKLCIKKKKMDKREHWGWPTVSVRWNCLLLRICLSLLLSALYLERNGVIYVVQLISVLQHHFRHTPNLVGLYMIKPLKRTHSLLALCTHPAFARDPIKQLSKQGPSKAERAT